MAITHLNPASLHANPALSQGTVIPAGASLVVVGGQNGIGSDGQVVGDSLAAQTEQAYRNLIAVLAEAGATPADVAKLTIILVEGVDVTEGFAAAQKVWGDQPTAVTVQFVRALARADCLSRSTQSPPFRPEGSDDDDRSDQRHPNGIAADRLRPCPMVAGSGAARESGTGAHVLAGLGAAGRFAARDAADLRLGR